MFAVERLLIHVFRPIAPLERRLKHPYLILQLENLVFEPNLLVLEYTLDLSVVVLRELQLLFEVLDVLFLGVEELTHCKLVFLEFLELVAGLTL